MKHGASAEVRYCSGTWINKANLIVLHGSSFPTGLGWHLGAYTVPAWNELDLRSVGTHEFGHMNGQVIGGDAANFGHWWESQDTDLCPDIGAVNYSIRESMCPTIHWGQMVQRIPSTHEKLLVQAAY